MKNNTPVAFIFFKRIETTKQVFEQIRKAAPQELYLIADGARNDKEQLMVEEVRKYVEESIDWECNVHRNYAPKNMGCKERIISGLNWVFENTDRAIILEDDVKPVSTFFDYAGELLERYENDEKVMMISGFNFNGTMDMEDSYWFYSRTSIWGWATWKRAWSRLDYNMENWPALKKSKYINKNFSKNVAAMLVRDTDRAYYGEVDTWDYTWEYSIILNKGLCIMPKVNMIENVGGNDINATHTFGDVENYETSEMQFPMKHPEKVELTKTYTQAVEDREPKVNVLKEKIKGCLPRKLVNKFRNVK